jgi:hypothetical protein
VSEWLTPLIEPLSLADCGAGTLTLHGSNFIATPGVRIGGVDAAAVRWVDASTLEVDLNAEMPLGRAELRVTNPRGQATVLPLGFQCGREAYLPLMGR